MSQTWAVIIAALITATATIVATRFDDIANLFRKPTRKIAGEWESISFKISNDPNVSMDELFESKQFVSITQKGDRAKAIMTQTELQRKDHIPKKFFWKGKIIGDYFVYESAASEQELFLISSAMLYIHPDGREMYGYFIANGGKNDPIRTWVGYAELKRKA